MDRKYVPLLVVVALAAWRWLEAQGGFKKMTKADFIAKLRPVAKAVEAETGIAAEIGMLQAAHESAYGASKLSDPAGVWVVKPAGSSGAANNLFGFTAELGTYWRTQNSPFVEAATHEWVKVPAKTDKVVSGPDKNGVYYVERVRPFRAYASWDLSYRDWARLMQTPAYKNAGAFDALKARDLHKFGEAMTKVGYATDPTYAAKLEKIGTSSFVS